MNKPTIRKPLLTSRAVMKILGYDNKWSFFKQVRGQKMPFIQVNAKRIMFDADELDAWLASRRSKT